MTLFRSTLCFLAAAAASAATDHTIRLAPIDVKTERDQTLTIPSLEEARLDLARVPGGTEAIDAERFLRGRASTANDLFALSAGVFAQSRFGSDEARISIRGSGLQRTFHGRGVRILQDGVPLNLADGSFDMQAFEPLAARYVNVWRGANALAFGASTLGGAIEFVSRTGHDAQPTVRLEAGSFGYARALAAAGATNERSDSYVAVTHTRQDGFRSHSRQENTRVFANAGWRARGFLEARFFLTAVRTDSELPGSLLKAEVARDPRQANPITVTQRQKRDFDLLRGASKTTMRSGDTVWDANVAWTYKDLDHPISPVLDQLSNDQLASLTATHVGTISDRAHRLKTGLLWTRSAMHAASFQNVAGRRGARLTQADTLATNTEFWIEEQLLLGRQWTLVAGATLAESRRENQPSFGGTGSYARRYRNASPKLGLRWDSARGVQVFANISASFEPPSFSETGALAAPNRAQRARTVEVGSRGRHGPWRWDAAIYSARLRDEFLSLNDAQGNPLGTINAPRTDHSGVEFAGEVDLLGTAWEVPTSPANRLSLRVAWTYGRFRFSEHSVYGDNPLAGFPPHLIRGDLTWETAAGWYLGPNWEAVPYGGAVDFANTLFADPYMIVGFRFGRRSSKGWSWFAEARNLADRHYAATTGAIANARGLDVRQFLPGETRAYYGGLEYRW